MCVGGRVPRCDGAFADREFGIGNDSLDVDIDHVAKALALWTGTERAIETKQTRFGLRIVDAAFFAAQDRAKRAAMPGAAVDVDCGRWTIFDKRSFGEDDCAAVAREEGRFQRISQPTFCRRIDSQTIDDDVHQFIG